MRFRSGLIGWSSWALVASWAILHIQAEVVRVQIDRQEDILNGRSWGLAGSYQKVTGKIDFAVDPQNPANRIITDIDKAPRNQAGKVEFSADFYLLKPKEMVRANGTLLFGVVNRGRNLMLRFFNLGTVSLDPETESDFGDGLLLRNGYTLLWVGWQFDPPRQEDLLRLYPPIASENGHPIRGLVRSDFVVTEKVFSHSLADRNHIPYPVADPQAAENVLTVREGREAPRRPIPRSNWEFARVEGERVAKDPGHVHLKEGFAPGKIYEVVYVSENPAVVGLGPAAVRDAVSHLKHQGEAELSVPEGAIRRAIGFGISQSGRFLRTFLYYGFNQDESGRRVFDGVMSHVAGGGRGSFNHRFAQPSRDAHPYMNFFYPTDIFPFSDLEQTDPETGLADGILTHHLKREFRPKIFYTNSSYEYWGRAASLIHTTVDGLRDLTLPENARVYLFAGSQHSPADFPPRKTLGQQPANTTDFRWSMRALLTAMDEWIGAGKLPPPSRYPRIQEKTLVRAEDLNFPKISGVGFSSRVHEAYRVDYGPHFQTKGIVTLEPPKIGKPFLILVPSVDADGNETSGIRMPEVAVPLATYTGWNLFNAGSGPTGEISSMVGSYIPFARTKAERLASGDQRPSIEERYASREHYLGLLTEAALELVREGYLLDDDVPEIVEKARRHWQYRMK